MKIGIALTGISYNDQVVPGTNWGRKRDWKKAVTSICTHVIDPLLAEHVSIYLYSYDNPEKEMIMQSLNPKKATWLPSYEDTDMARTFLQGLIQLKDEDLDLIIATRFDILFNMIPWYINPNWNPAKFNFLFREKGWRDYNFTTDTFYVFPYKYLDKMIYGLSSMIVNPPPPKNIGMHNLYTSLLEYISVDEIDFICRDIEHLSHDNPIFTLTREE